MPALPLNNNTTCDIYRNGNSPPAAPDVAAVKIFLTANFAQDHDKAITGTTYLRWTHTALVPLGTDIRDGYAAGLTSVNAVNQDTIYVPDKNGTHFTVIFVERINRNTPQDCFRVYLQRVAPGWPTQQL
jgi:hypothetical protein